MSLKCSEIAKMLDLSCVQVSYNKSDVEKLVQTAIKYECGQISVLQCMLKDCKRLLEGTNGIGVVGNVSFPSGSDSSELKVIQAKQMVDIGCDEIDMVMNLYLLKSGQLDMVADDIKRVVDAVENLPLKVIIETPCLTEEQIKIASELCIKTGASFVKTGTGWTGPTTLRHVELIKSVVGNDIKIKASAGVKSLELLLDMYAAGATRFGVNLQGCVHILEQCKAAASDIART